MTTLQRVGEPRTLVDQDQDVIEYQVLRHLTELMRKGDRAPRCTALSFVPGAVGTTGNFVHCRDRGSRWVSMSFVPRRHMLRLDEDVFLVTVRETDTRFGVARVGPGQVVSQHDWGLSRKEDEVGGVPLADRRLIRVCIDLNWANLSYAFLDKSRYDDSRDAFLDFIEGDGLPFRVRRRFRQFVLDFFVDNGRLPTTEEKLDNMFLFGGETSSSAAAFSGRMSWLPEPYLSFDVAARQRLFKACFCREHKGDTKTDVPDFVISRMLGEIARTGELAVTSSFEGVVVRILDVVEDGFDVRHVVCQTARRQPRTIRVSNVAEIDVGPGDKLQVGDVIGRERPIADVKAFAAMTTVRRITVLKQVLGRAGCECLIRDWFDRLGVELMVGRVHFPATVASAAASLSDANQMIWRLDRSLRWWVEESDSFAFPVLQEPKIGHHKWAVSRAHVETVVDLTPQDVTYSPERADWRRPYSEEELLAVQANKRSPGSATLKVFSGRPALPDLPDTVLDYNRNGNRG